jgi:uncharacterized protein
MPDEHRRAERGGEAVTMMLQIGHGLALPHEAICETFAILGKRGSGKTNTAVVLVEEMVAAKLPVCIVDPVGVWHGLRSSADGKTAGLPVTIVGGEHGDVPLEETAGRALAEFVVEEHAQVLLDLSHLRKGAQVRFMTDFAEALYHLKAKRRDPLHLVIDECDAFAPQRTGPEGARLLGAMEDLIRRGRSRGLGMTMITQRPAVLNKNVLTQAEVLVVLKLTAPQDQAAIDDWVRANADEAQRKEVASSLPSLPVGTAWFWSPGWLDVFKKVRVRARRTFDSSATPKPGQRAIAPRELAPVDLEALKHRIAATIEKVKAEDPKTLRARIAELDKEIRSARASAPALPPVEVRVEVPVVPEELKADIAALTVCMRAHARGLMSEADAMERRLEEAALGVAKVQRPSKPNGAHHARATTPPETPRPRRTTFDPAQALIANGARLAGGERKILTVLAQHPDGRTKVQVAILTGYAHSGGGFSNYISALRTRGLLEGGGDCLRITEVGRAALGTFEPLPVGRALLEYWKANAGGKAERKVLEELAAVHPRTLDKRQLASRSGYEANGGGFNNALSRLRTLQLIRGRAELAISPTLVGG